MDGGQILLSYIKVWVILLLLSATFPNSKLAAKNTEQDKKRKLAAENSGISIDCGADEDYTDRNTGISYKTDKDFISTGKNKVVAPEYDLTSTLYYGKMVNSLRIFPEGDRNCYTLKPREGKNQNYYVRAFFRYGNYDSKNQTQIKFDLYIGVNYWATVEETFENKYWINYDIIHYSVTDTIYVCLVNTGFGVPFISGLDLLFMNDSSYRSMNGSLLRRVQADLGGEVSLGTIRYPDDVYARIWQLDVNLTDSVSNISTEAITNIDIQGSDNRCRLPVEVLRTAVQPRNGLKSLSYTYTSPYKENFTPEFLVFFHFAEIEQIAGGKLREFTITLNGLKYGLFTLEYLKPLTIGPYKLQDQEGLVRFSIDASSDLPPILNAFEIFELLPLHDSPTNQTDVDAIMAIKKAYKIDRVDWQGDPCLPRITTWTGLQCNNDNPPRIISLNLSSSQLSGNIDVSLLSLTTIQSLDLSNNELTGTVPEAFAQLPHLTILYLSRNKLTGAVPYSLKEKSKSRQLQLSLDGNLDLCKIDTCEKKQGSFPVPVIASVISVSVLLLLSIITIFWRLKRENSTNMLNWRARLQIAVDAAQGLEYLHNGCRPPIVHRDLKSSNILLTENLQAKIADFGLSKAFANEGDSHVTTVPAGTPGYIDPEFRASGNLNKKSDVYSFGILLCELITGQPPLIRGHQGHTHILQWVSPLVERGDIQSIIDPRLQGEFNTNCAWKALEIALSCVPPTSIQRPDMSDILGELKECLAMEMSSEISMCGSVEMSLVLGTDMAPNLR
ncbi:probable LRR receptor-like serine/threonine-protein kinase At1g51810 isoform X11 [Populus trichocarpa]|uniref:probable LRR receptor-like serine/threonine-protein kinase At1g51810 isoform X11 n=1 Tax=Populus trichocarpa TaxID=3694 RepID=UPI002278E43F|nr:probable LRR receptor-like serine/threonine-protein kinase At1g51810 isoform X11 [Populus trichocarpa]